MKSDYSTKNPVDFDELRKGKFSLEIDIRVHEKWLKDHPRSHDSLKSVEEARKKIAEIDKLLAKEPPPPELPPRQPLIKACGILEEIETLFARGYFTDREYEPEEFARKERSRQWGSVLLAAIGGSAAAAVNSQDEIRPVRKYYFAKGKINGKNFHGWLGRVSAEPGDYIELAAMDKGDHYEAYALAIPELEVVSVMPECDSGSKSRGFFELKGAFYLWLALLIFISLILTFMDDINMKDAIYFIFLCSVGFAILFALVGIGAYINWLIKPRPSALLAHKIFSILGMSEPESVDLAKYTKKLLKTKPAHKNSKRHMPDKNCSSDYYFYYARKMLCR